MCRIALSLILTLMLTTAAAAGIQPKSYTLSSLAGGHVIDEDQHLENSLFWSLGLGYNLTERAALEAVFSKTDADGKTSATSDAVIKSGRIDALYHFRPGQRLVPYLATGFGEIILHSDSGRSQDHWLADIGGGIKYFFNDLIALRVDLRYLLDFPEPQHNLLCSSGLYFQFGKPPAMPAPVDMKATAPAAKPAAPLDSDGDGVSDETDQCPGTLPGVRTGNLGCPK